MKNRLNINEILWGMILGALAMTMLHLLITDRIGLYLHPKMVKFVWFTVVILGAMALYQLTRFNKPSTTSIRKGYFLFVLPVVLFLLNPSLAQSEMLVNKNKDISARKVEDTGQKEEPLEEETSDKEEGIESYNYQNLLEQASETEGDESDEDPFFEKVMAVGASPDEYIGKPMTLEGFVYKEEGYYQENQFVIARLLMTCCAADTTIVGFLCESDMAQEFASDEWVRVTGILEEEPFYDTYTQSETTTFVIKVTEIEKITPYDSPYIYYYW